MSRSTPLNQQEANTPDPAWLERYSRQLLLKEVGGEGQARLGQSVVGIVGTGWMATPLILYLVAAGIGHLVLLGHAKQTTTLSATLHDLNPLVKITLTDIPHTLEQSEEQMLSWHLTLLVEADPTIRHRFNKAALHTHKTIISGWQIDTLYAITTAHAGHDPQAPCLLCLESACITHVAPPIPPSSHPILTQMAAGLVGSVLAMESLIFLLDTQQKTGYSASVFYPEEGRYDAVSIPKNPLCPLCSGRTGG